MPGNAKRRHAGIYTTLTWISGRRISRRRGSSRPHAIREQRRTGEPASRCQFPPITRDRGITGIKDRIWRIGHPAVNSITATHSLTAPYRRARAIRKAGRLDGITIGALYSPSHKSDGWISWCTLTPGTLSPCAWKRTSRDVLCHWAIANLTAVTGSWNIWLQRRHPHPVRIKKTCRHVVVVVTAVQMKAHSPLLEV